MSFAEDARSGVTLLTIQGAHTLDFAAAVLASLVDLTGLTTQYPLVTVGDSETEQSRTKPDLLAQVRFGAGTALAVEVAGSQAPESTTFRLEILTAKEAGSASTEVQREASSQAN